MVDFTLNPWLFPRVGINTAMPSLVVPPFLPSQLWLAGWWLSHPSEKYEFISWDYYSQHMEK
jgi:hypothetical protein